MKIAIALAIGLLFSSIALAKPNCSYKLNHEAYWEDASGTLTIDAQQYRCKSLVVGQDGVLLTVCKDPKKRSVKPETFDFIVDFDGAEGNFFVSTDFDRKNQLCAGIASEK